MTNLVKFTMGFFLFLICTTPMWAQVSESATPKVVKPTVEDAEVALVIDDAENAAITKTLNDYIEGTANGEADRVRNAFHEDLNLYSINNDTLRTWSGNRYISNFEDGKKRNRIGKIISIDYENDAAVAKVEILMPEMGRVYTDYMMLLKVEGQWKIIHKSFTYRMEE